MLFYLSFLRPPPRSVSVAPNGKGKASNVVQITLTPQIANDLRITYFEDAIDIFYSWVRVSPSNGPAIASGQLTESSSIIGFMEPKMKLTTWHRSSMYKTLNIPLPHTAKRGQEWRLALLCQPSTAESNGSSSKVSLDSVVIDLAGQTLGDLPFPVMSMPVRIEDDITPISTKKTKAGSNAAAKNSGREQNVKQNQIERFYRMSVSPTSDVLVASVQENPDSVGPPSTEIICLREDTSFDLDKKVWDSGLILGSWLSKLFISHQRQTEDTSNPSRTRLWNRIYPNPDTVPSRVRVLELGCGTGIVSICLATLLNRSASIQTGRSVEIIASDLASAIPIVDHNISVNKHVYPSVDIESLVLDWDNDILPPKAAALFDLVIMADVSYNTASFPSLVRTVCNLVKPPDAPNPTSDDISVHRPYLLMAYKQRDRAERNLWDMLEENGIVLTLIDKINTQRGDGGGESSYNSGSGVDEKIEIWVWLP